MFDGLPETFFESGNFTNDSTAIDSANIVTLPKFGGFFLITGAAINAVASLRLNSNFAATGDDTITLRSDGTNWVEVARSVNV